MKILVAIKRAIDYNVVIQVKSDGTGVETDRVKMSMNPFDEIACEQAIRLKESQHASHVRVMTIGPPAAEDVLRKAYAMGADSALHVVHDDALESLDIAKIIASEAKNYGADLILMGKQSIDTDHHQTAEMCAAILDWPQVTQGSAISVQDHVIRVTHEVDQGTEISEFNSPGLITTDLRCHKPRIVTLPNLMKARSKIIDKITLSETGIEPAERLRKIKVTEPVPRVGQKPFDTLELFIKACQDKGIL